MAKSKSKQKNKKRALPKSTKLTPKLSGFIHYTINFLVAAAVTAFVFGSLYYIPGLDFLPNRIIKANLEFVSKNDTLSLGQRTAAKMGWSSYFFDNIRSKVPEDAIVLLPPQKVISTYNKDKKHKKQQINYYKTPAWVNYYMHPVRYVYADSENSPLLTEVTHVAVFNRWGYSHLTYKPDKYSAFDVLPIKK